MINAEDILPGFASAINVIALFKPIENNSSTFSNLADLFSHFKYGPNLPTLSVMSLSLSGFFPREIGSEQRNLALSKSITL